MSKTSIGLDKVQSAELANKLNELMQPTKFSILMRGYHWNIKGVNFFALVNAKFGRNLLI